MVSSQYKLHTSLESSYYYLTQGRALPVSHHTQNIQISKMITLKFSLVWKNLRTGKHISQMKNSNAYIEQRSNETVKRGLCWSVTNRGFYVPSQGTVATFLWQSCHSERSVSTLLPDLLVFKKSWKCGSYEFSQLLNTSN